jgi:Skp family chaperone for outer membrane proteins
MAYLGAAVAGLALCGGSQAGAATRRHSLRVALVDVERVLREYKKGNDRYDQIRKEMEPLINEIKQKVQAIREERRRLAADPRTDAVEYLKKKQELELKIAELERDEKSFLAKKTAKEIAAMMEVWNDVIAAVSKHAKDQGIDLVLKQQVRTGTPKRKSTFYRNVAARTVLYAAAHLDITEEVIKQLNGDYERGRGAPKG